MISKDPKDWGSAPGGGLATLVIPKTSAEMLLAERLNVFCTDRDLRAIHIEPVPGEGHHIRLTVYKNEPTGDTTNG